MKITVLIENELADPTSELHPEHGLSLYLQVDGTNILYDTGATGLFADNAEKLGVDLAAVDIAVISHGHYDHGGGLLRFFEVNDQAPVYMRRRADEEHQFRFLFLKRDIGIAPEVFARYQDRIHFVDGRTEICENVFLLTDIKQTYPLVKANRVLLMRQGDRFVPDDFEHELILVVREDDGLVILLGCGHNHVLNMVESVREQFPGESIKAVMGGFHLAGLPRFRMMAESDTNVRRIGQTLLNYDVGMTYTCHCTGDKAYRTLKEVMKDKIDYSATGRTIEL